MTNLICNAYLTEDEMYDLLNKGYEIHLVVNYPHFRDDTHEVLEEIVINKNYRQRGNDEEYDFWEHSTITYKTFGYPDDPNEEYHFGFQNAMREGEKWSVIVRKHETVTYGCLVQFRGD